MSWLFLMPPVIGLIWVCWPMGAHHQVSFMWIAVFIVVLIFEAYSKFFTPDKMTISNVIRADRKKGTAELVRFWLGGTFWMLFAWLLWVHFAT